MRMMKLIIYNECICFYQRATFTAVVEDIPNIISIRWLTRYTHNVLVAEIENENDDDNNNNNNNNNTNSNSNSGNTITTIITRTP